jgi:hypothetical protein
MLAKYLKLVTFASEVVLNLDYFVSTTIKIFLEPITNLKRTLIYAEIRPLLIVA